jgi:hypothetical protein
MIHLAAVRSRYRVNEPGGVDFIISLRGAVRGDSRGKEIAQVPTLRLEVQRRCSAW